MARPSGSIPPDSPHAFDTLELISLARNGCSEALGQLYRLYHPMLAKSARALLDRQLRRKVDELDLVQEVFLQVKQGIAKFKGATTGAWEAWLKQILAHEIRDVAKHYRGTAKRNLGLEVGLGERSALSLPSLHDIEEMAARSDARELLSTILARLPVDLHCVLVWRYLVGYSFKIIATSTGCNIGSLRKQCGRALERARHDAQLLRGPAPSAVPSMPWSGQ